MENATTMTMRALLNLTAVSSSPFNNNHPNHRPSLPSLRNCGFTTAGNNPRCRELTAIQTPQPAVSDNTRPLTPCFNEVLQYNNLYFFFSFQIFSFPFLICSVWQVDRLLDKSSGFNGGGGSSFAGLFVE